MSRKRSWTDEQLAEAIKISGSWAKVARRLKLKLGGGTSLQLKLTAKRLNLNTEHMRGQAWRQGRQGFLGGPRIPLTLILVENSTYLNTTNLRLRLLREGVKEHRCEKCGNTEWQGRPIPLELEHRSGIRNDNRLENLELLCPNCHALTPTYCGKNIGRYDLVPRMGLEPTGL